MILLSLIFLINNYFLLFILLQYDFKLTSRDLRLSLLFTFSFPRWKRPCTVTSVVLSPEKGWKKPKCEPPTAMTRCHLRFLTVRPRISRGFLRSALSLTRIFSYFRPFAEESISVTSADPSLDEMLDSFLTDEFRFIQFLETNYLKKLQIRFFLIFLVELLVLQTK